MTTIYDPDAVVGERGVVEVKELKKPRASILSFLPAMEILNNQDHHSQGNSDGIVAATTVVAVTKPTTSLTAASGEADAVINKVAVTKPKGRILVNGVTAGISTGEVLAIMGPSGAGE